MVIFRLSALVAAIAAVLATPAMAVVNVTVSGAGSAAASVTGYDLYVNNLDNAANGLLNFGFAGSPITATNSGFVNIGAANVFGGAGGAGQFGTVTGDSTFQLSSGVNYFGLWGSALDGNNTVELYNDSTLLGSYALQSTLQAQPNFSSAYYGNPFGGGNTGELYAFFNFVSDSAFNRVRLLQNGGGGFEFDNLTVGTVSGAPEPATWAMMMLGFGIIGWSMRRAKPGQLVAVRALA